MISGVTIQIGGASETFRLTTRAMMALEETTGKGIVDFLQEVEAGFRIGTFALLLAEIADDGAGRDIPWAQSAIDQIGFARAVALVGEVSEAAFPEAKGAAKNLKRAVRSA